MEQLVRVRNTFPDGTAEVLLVAAAIALGAALPLMLG